jgi:hypothetical protein
LQAAHDASQLPKVPSEETQKTLNDLLVRVRLLNLKNLDLKDRYALIKGELGEYSVHLGSAVTRKMPGETLFIVPVHSQHRGRLFLSFADDGPRTAEVMSKVLRLARDQEIRDPNILDQLRG